MAWYNTTAIYQIYPRSFYDSNGDGIGDLNGIIQKLDYIRDLGFETIWISPFYTSPQVDFGYDIADYFNIAPEYGTLQDAEALIAACHDKGLKIVFDMVMNHTSDQHAWFLESKSSRINPKADWYIWRDQPNNWKSIVGPKGWHYCKERDQYYFASFLPFQPDLNYQNPAVKQQMFDACRFWLAKGVDGFRLDIFNCIIKDPQFRDNPFSILCAIPSEEYPGGNFQVRKYSVNQPENFTLAKELRSVINEFQPARLLLGEVFGKHKLKKQYLGERQDGLHLIFLFDVVMFNFDAGFFRKKILEYEKEYPKPYTPVIVFSNHDQLRSIGRLRNNLEKAKLLALLQYTMRGVPTVYYGEEIGMTNVKIPIKIAKDALAHTFSWVPQFLADRIPVPINRDVCRTPMQWNNGKNAGFSAASSTWLPIADDLENRNVAQQQADEQSLLNVFKKLNQLRKDYTSLQDGSIEVFSADSKDLLAFLRSSPKEKLLIILNFSSEDRGTRINFNIKEKVYTLKQSVVSGNQITLQGFGGVLLRV
ncbi:MAG: alpha-glucosidase [Sphingobacteriales bacterium]|jgi:glycosidase|nr:alpha-glucosidase [Sphingobacteriales bacterium]